MSTEPNSDRATPQPAGGPVPAASALKAKRHRNSDPPLLFVDTNIFLDFYRSRSDAGISLLSKIDALHDKIITTCQVEMEFKKNRQKVISESVSLLKPPEFSLVTPAFLSDAKTVELIKKRIADAKKRVGVLKARILSTLENPQAKDRIYQTAQRLFTNKSKLNLRHDTPEYNRIWRKAFRRFLEGRPPRKKEDTSAGDAINWEWIVRCIEDTNRDVIIVSRDADYGLTMNGKGYANNWLSEEIKERVNQQRKLILVDRLSAALKLLDVKVTREEITSERATIVSTADEMQGEMEALIEQRVHDLVNADAVNDLIANTNAFGWGLDVYDLFNGRFENGRFVGQLEFSISGEQDDDKPWHGTTISGNCLVAVDMEKNVTFSHIEAELEGDEPDEPDEDTAAREKPPEPPPDQNPEGTAT